MSYEKYLGWARNVFMMLVMLGGLATVQSSVLAAETSSTSEIPSQTFSVMVNQPLRVTLQVEGGTAPYRWSMVQTVLPEGMFFDAATGLLWGTPVRVGESRFSVQATDGMGLSFTKMLTVNVHSGEVVVTPTTTVGFAPTVTITQPTLPEPISIDLNTITDSELKLLVDTFPDDAPLIYVGPNAPTSILKVNIAQMRIKPNGLYRVEGGTASTVNESHKYSDVYYVDPTGRRHAFSTESVFKSWYKDEPTIEAVPDWKISNIPLRQNVTFRPGTIVRLEDTQEFYHVAPHRTLKKFQTAPQTLVTVPILPLAHVADYTMDMNTIMTSNDMMTMYPLPTQPGQEMGE
jgi:hypothetical protein